MTASETPSIPSDARLTALARDLGEALRACGCRVACVESCTGGWLARTLTDIPGCSEWFGWGWVAYANEAKRELVGVPAALLTGHGAVSEAVATAMARGARRLSGAEFAVAVSGVAGPGGGTPDKPVGTVCFAWQGPESDRGDGPAGVAERRVFAGGRECIRRQAVAHALQGLLNLVCGCGVLAGAQSAEPASTGGDSVGAAPAEPASAGGDSVGAAPAEPASAGGDSVGAVPAEPASAGGDSVGRRERD